MGWYYIISEEHVKTGLRGKDLVIYAIIEGFSRKNGGCYYGGNRLLADMAGISLRTAQYGLRSLVSQGFIFEAPIRVNGKDMVAYSTHADFAPVTHADFAQEPMQKMSSTHADFAPNNKDITETMSPKSKKENTSTTFTPPTVEEVYQYVKDKGMRDPEGFAQYYVEEQTAQGWTRKDGGKKVPVRDWKGNVRQWMPNHMTHIFPKQAAEPKKPMTVDEYFKTR